jgi:transposase
VNVVGGLIAKIAGDWPASRWDELMPWNWRRANEQPIAEAA